MDKQNNFQFWALAAAILADITFKDSQVNLLYLFTIMIQSVAKQSNFQFWPLPAAKKCWLTSSLKTLKSVFRNIVTHTSAYGKSSCPGSHRYT